MVTPPPPQVKPPGVLSICNFWGLQGGGGFNTRGVLLQSGGKITPRCIARLPPYCLHQSIWQILCSSLPCDDDALEMFDIADAESISHGDATGLLCSVCSVPRHRGGGFMIWNFWGPGGGGFGHTVGAQTAVGPRGMSTWSAVV